MSDKDLSKPVAWAFKEEIWSPGCCGYVWRDKLEDDHPGDEGECLKDVRPLYSAEYVQSLLGRIAELEAERETMRSIECVQTLLTRIELLERNHAMLCEGMAEIHNHVVFGHG